MLINEFIVEQENKIPVRAKVDVIVAGGGLAGISAAVASARAGAKTILIERNSFPGGVATAGMCCSVFNCFYTPGHNLVVKGNPLEIVNRLAEQAGGPGLEWHNHKGHIIYDVEQAKTVLTELLEESGVVYLFETVTSNVIMNGSKLCGVIIESKSGREAILSSVVIDATGDSDLAVRCGAPCHEYENNNKSAGYPASFVFRVGGVHVDDFVKYFAENPSEYPEGMDIDWTLDEAIDQYKKTGTFLFPHGGGMQMKIIQKGIAAGEYPQTIGVHKTLNALQMHAIKKQGVVHIITGFVDIDGLDIGKIGQAVLDGRRMAFAVTEYFKAHVPGFEQAYVAQTANNLGIRTSRWINGDFSFKPEMRGSPYRCPDSIGRGVVQYDYIKHKGENAWAVQSFGEDYFQIPYACLLPQKIKGLLMGSGRSVSSLKPSLLRVMVTTMTVGQGAGVAAAISAKTGVSPRYVDISQVQSELIRQGVDI